AERQAQENVSGLCAVHAPAVVGVLRAVVWVCGTASGRWNCDSYRIEPRLEKIGQRNVRAHDRKHLRRPPPGAKRNSVCPSRIADFGKFKDLPIATLGEVRPGQFSPMGDGSSVFVGLETETRF